MADLYEITVPAAEYPVSLADCKEYMKITSTAEDNLITDLIIAATNSIEDYTGQYFVVRTVQGDFDSLFCTGYERYQFVPFRRAPVNTVTSVQVLIDSTYTDEAYQLKKKNHGYTRFLFDSFDVTPDDVPFPVRIITTVGYGAATAVPMEIKIAIMGYVNFMHKNRNDCIDASACSQVMQMSGFPAGVASTINRYRIIEVFA